MKLNFLFLLLVVLISTFCECQYYRRHHRYGNYAPYEYYGLGYGYGRGYGRGYGHRSGHRSGHRGGHRGGHRHG